MQLIPRSRPISAAVATGTVALAVLFVGATAAVAAPAAATDRQTETVEQNEPAQQTETEPGTSLETSPQPPGCADLLVTFHRDATVGDDRAVAITAQALERTVDGWQLLAWQADPGTTLTLVLATGANGELRELPPTTSGVVENVRSVTFCGHYEGLREVIAEPQPSAPTTEPPPDSTKSGNEPGHRQSPAAEDPERDDTDSMDTAAEVGSGAQPGGATAAEVGSGAQPGGATAAEVDAVGSAITGPPPTARKPAGTAAQPGAVAELHPPAEELLATAPAIVPVTLTGVAGPSEALDTEAVGGPKRGGGWLLLMLLVAAGSAAALRAGRWSATRRRAIPAAPHAHLPHEHMEVGR
jgi:hypothetical protein